MSCMIENCTNPTLYKCVTCDPYNLFCDRHSNDHIDLNPIHDIESLYLAIDKKTKLTLIKRIASLQRKVSNARKAITKQANDLNQRICKQTNYTLMELREIEIVYHNAIEDLSGKKAIDLSNLSKSEELIVKMIESKAKIEEEIKLIEKTTDWADDFILEEINVKKIIEDLTKQLDIMNEKYNFLLEGVGGNTVIESLQFNKDNIPKIHYFKSNTKELVTVDVLEGGKDSVTAIAGLLDNQCYWGRSLYVSNNELFCYGGHNGNTKTDWIYLIDIEQSKGLKLGTNKNIKYQGLYFHNKLLYVFGGYIDNTCTSEAQVAILKNDWKTSGGISSDAWKQLAPLPIANHGINCTHIGNSIILLGYNTPNMQIYDTTLNLYTIAHAFTPNHHRVMLSIADKIYIFDSNCLFRINKLNLRQCSKIALNTCVASNSFIIAPSILYKNKFYFILADFNLYCFDLETEKASLIKKVG